MVSLFHLSLRSLLLVFLLSAFAHAEQGQKLPLEEIQVGSKKIKVEVARTPAQLSTGLMYRKKLEKDSGMLFIFKEERILSFWMKNTFIPLSIGFFDADKELVEILEMEPVKSVMQLDIPRYQSKAEAVYALEMNEGWFKKNGIEPGARLVLPKRK